MSDLWMLGPNARAVGLRRLGFTPREANRLVQLKMRYVRGAFRELTEEQKRMKFVCWLVDHGRLGEGAEGPIELAGGVVVYGEQSDCDGSNRHL